MIFFSAGSAPALSKKTITVSCKTQKMNYGMPLGGLP